MWPQIRPRHCTGITALTLHLLILAKFVMSVCVFVFVKKDWRQRGLTSERGNGEVNLGAFTLCLRVQVWWWGWWTVQPHKKYRYLIARPSRHHPWVITDICRHVHKHHTVHVMYVMMSVRDNSSRLKVRRGHDEGLISFKIITFTKSLDPVRSRGQSYICPSFVFVTYTWFRMSRDEVLVIKQRGFHCASLNGSSQSHY